MLVYAPPKYVTKTRSLKNIGLNVSVNPDNFVKSNLSNDSELKDIIQNLGVNQIDFTEGKRVQEHGKLRCNQVQRVLQKDTVYDRVYQVFIGISRAR